MSSIARFFFLYKKCSVIGLLLIALGLSTSVHAQSVEPPKEVTALIYSNTAAELFWKKSNAPDTGLVYRVQVKRNGQLLGEFDSNGLFQAGLQANTDFSYELRSVASDGQLSPAVMLSLSTANFSQPSQRIYGVEQGGDISGTSPAQPQNTTDTTNTDFSQQTIAPPSNVRASVYSNTAAELFWVSGKSLETGISHRVQIKRNGEDLGERDASSLYQDGLSPGTQYNFELRSVTPDGQLSSVVTTTVTTNGGTTSVATPAVTSPPSLDPTPVVVDTQPAVNAQPINDSPQITQGNNNCIARDLAGLRSCVGNAGAFNRIDIAQDITCDGNCCPNGVAMMRFDNVSNLHIAGNGNRILRKTSQRQCSLIDITRSNNLRVSDIYLDDDKNVAGCQVAEQCPRMVHVRQSNNISFESAHISHGKGYTFYVQGTDGFNFQNSSLHNSGVLGLYVGHGNDASRNISITNSVFSDNQTNGLALLGLTGTSVNSNVGANNTFVRNHRRGQWAVAPQFGTGFTGGGQFYIAQASHLTVRDNVVKDGYCDNCFVQRRHRSGVSGIELGLPGSASVSNIVLSGNRVINHDGFAISQNSNSSLSNVRLLNNVLLNATSGEHVDGATKSGNRVLDTQHFYSFEGGNDLNGRFSTSVSCSAGGAVRRQCGAGSRYGQCAAQLQLANADCADMRAELRGPIVGVRAGQLAVASGWVENPAGRWCLVFRDSSGNAFREQCRNLSDADYSDVQSFVGLPSIEAYAPGGSATLQIKVVLEQPRSSMLIDDLKLSVGD
jgi:hypothetical protein